MLRALCWALNVERTASWAREDSPFADSLANSVVDAGLAMAFSLFSKFLKPRAGAGTFEDAAAATACLGAGAASCDWDVGLIKALEDLAETAPIVGAVTEAGLKAALELAALKAPGGG